MAANLASRQKEIDIIKYYFQQDSTRFEQVEVVGSGEFGVCFRVVRKAVGRRKAQKFVIKRANSERQQQTLKSDIQRLKVCRRKGPSSDKTYRNKSILKEMTSLYKVAVIFARLLQLRTIHWMGLSRLRQSPVITETFSSPFGVLL